MTLITDLPERVVGVVDGSEEYVINVGGVDMKILGSSITASVIATHAAYVLSNDAAVTTLTNDKLAKAGGTMTGFLTLNANPTANLHSTTKQYVDGLLAAKADATGQTFDATTTAITAANTLETTALATTAYVAAKIEYESFKKTIINTATHTLLEAEKGRVMVERTSTGTCVITLPLISSLSAPDRAEYYIIDAAFNAETYSITVNKNAADSFNDSSSSKTITTKGASLLIAVSGTTEWTILDQDAIATSTTAGILRTATTAEAEALSIATAVITPSTLGNVLDKEIYNTNELGTASKVFVEADGGSTWWVSQTASSTVAITLPNPSALAIPNRFTLEIYDAGNATTNNITITPSGGLIDGTASVVISDTKAGMKIITDGTNYYTIANTARATAVATSTSVSTLANVLAAGNATGAVDVSVDSGQVVKFNNGGFTGTIAEGTLTADVVYTLPTVTGTIALTSTVLALAGGTMTGDITMATGNTVKLSNGGFTASITEPTLAGNIVLTLPTTTGTIALASDITTQIAAYTGTASVVTVGTIATGTWNGTAITSAYLDLSTVLAKTGGTMTGTINYNGSTAAVFNSVMSIYDNGGASLVTSSRSIMTVSNTNGSGSLNLIAPYLKIQADRIEFNVTEDISGNGAVSQGAGAVVHLQSTATGNTLTLPTANEGTIKMISYESETAGTDTYILTDTFLGGYTTITFNDVGDSATLLNIGGAGLWKIMSVFKAVVA